MIFADRITAAEKLAEALSEYQDKNPLILAIPRGAVPMAKVIAEQLNGEMDVVLVRKLRAPGNPEFAIGSVDESGWVYLTEYAEQAGANQDYINQEVSVQLETIRQRRVQYTPMHPPVDPALRIDRWEGPVGPSVKHFIGELIGPPRDKVAVPHAVPHE